MLAPKSDVEPDTGSDRLASILFVLVWAWTVVPKIIQTIAVPKYRTYVNQSGAIPEPLTTLSSDALLIALLGFSMFVILNALRFNPRRNPGGLVLMLAPWAYIQLRDWLSIDPFRVASLAYLLPVIAIWLLRPGLRQLQLLGYLVGVVALVSVVLGVLLPSHAIFRNASGAVITEDKNLLPWGTLIGIYTHGNSLGQFLALGIPMITLIQRKFIRFALMSISLFALVWSAARSSIYSVGGLIVAVFVIATMRRGRRAVPAALALIVAYALVAIVPLATRDPMGWSNRGFIWGASLLAWHAKPWFGYGSRYYTDLAQTSGELGGTVYHGHNEVVQLLVIGGLVFAGIVAVLVLTAIVKAARWTDSGLFAFSFMFILAGASLLETSLLFGDNAFLLPVMVVPLATLMFAPPPDPSLPGSRDADLLLIGDDPRWRLP